MRKSIHFLAAAVLGLAAAASCASPEKMAKMAENVSVICNPPVLEAVAGKVEATVTVSYPKDYFNPKAILEVTPVIVYDGGEAKLPALYYQGEKVKDNYKVVSSDGQTITEKLSFDYVEGMENCYLELRAVARAKKKFVTLPTRKVAVGCNTTYMLVEQDGSAPLKDDGYQEVVAISSEGQILYLVNSSEVRSAQLRSQSIKDFQAALDQISADERTRLVGTEIVAYASPEGAEDLNNNLSARRSQSANQVWSQVVKGHEATDPEVKSVGEDWEGFQKLVSESNIEDKDLILRVLSMYSDPAVRESEIRNMSEVFTELKGEVLPELRRARLIVNSEFQNYTAEELLDLAEKNVAALDEPALLRAARLQKDTDKKISLYERAVSKFDSDAARFNLATVYANKGDYARAESILRNLEKDADVNNLLGVIEMRRGNTDAAIRCFTAAGSDAAQANLGAIDILQGDYEMAVKHLSAVSDKGFNLALAYILTDQLDKASAAIKCNCPKSNYLRAIIAARQGNAAKVKEYLDIASKSDYFRQRAAKDIEFADYR